MADRLGLADEAALLKTYFDRDARLFQYVGVIGAGATGAASRVNYYNENSNTFHSYIVKRALLTPLDQHLLMLEEQWLRVRHI